MKKVVSNVASTVSVNEAVLSKYYGVEGASERGFIVQTGAKEFRVFCGHRITTGNGWDGFRGASLHEVLEGLVSSGMMEVFEFETFKELFEWVSKTE